MEKRGRITIKLAPDQEQLIEKFAVEKGISKSMIVNLAVSAGFKAIAIAADPLWQKYFEKEINSGGKSKK
jgi:uncharacterized protein (DUF1778 family)